MQHTIALLISTRTTQLSFQLQIVAPLARPLYRVSRGQSHIKCVNDLYVHCADS